MVLSRLDKAVDGELGPDSELLLPGCVANGPSTVRHEVVGIPRVRVHVVRALFQRLPKKQNGHRSSTRGGYVFGQAYHFRSARVDGSSLDVRLAIEKLDAHLGNILLAHFGTSILQIVDDLTQSNGIR